MCSGFGCKVKAKINIENGGVIHKKVGPNKHTKCQLLTGYFPNYFNSTFIKSS